MQLSIGINLSIDSLGASLGSLDVTNDILNEDGTFLLLEDGSKILME